MADVCNPKTHDTAFPTPNSGVKIYLAASDVQIDPLKKIRNS